MSNNDLPCDKCHSQHHPAVECIPEKLMLEKPVKKNPKRDHILDPVTRFECQGYDKAIDEYDPYHEQTVKALEKEVANEKGKNKHWEMKNKELKDLIRWMDSHKIKNKELEDEIAGHWECRKVLTEHIIFIENKNKNLLNLLEQGRQAIMSESYDRLAKDFAKVSDEVDQLELKCLFRLEEWNKANKRIIEEQQKNKALRDLFKENKALMELLERADNRLKCSAFHTENCKCLTCKWRADWKEQNEKA